MLKKQKILSKDPEILSKPKFFVQNPKICPKPEELSKTRGFVKYSRISLPPLNGGPMINNKYFRDKVLRSIT